MHAQRSLSHFHTTHPLATSHTLTPHTNKPLHPSLRARKILLHNNIIPIRIEVLAPRKPMSRYVFLARIIDILGVGTEIAGRRRDLVRIIVADLSPSALCQDLLKSSPKLGTQIPKNTGGVWVRTNNSSGMRARDPRARPSRNGGQARSFPHCIQGF